MTDRIRWTQDGRALDLTLVGRLLPPEAVAGDAHCRIGGQAHLYRVRTPTGEVRACKLAIDPENNSLLRREHDHYQRLHRDSARAAEWLLRCHGQGEHEGRAFLVLDWVEQSLRDRFPTAPGAQNLAAGPGPSLRDRLRWAAAACDTIAAFHAAAGSTIIHQDIKPGNFLVAAEDPPRLLLSDLAGSRGLLRKTNGRSTTRPGAVTEGYAPPELELPQGIRRPTVQVDRFSLAVTVYELVTGQRPLKAGLSGAFSSEGRRLHDLHREVTLGEGLPGEEEEEYRVLSEKALPELLYMKGTLLGPRFGEHLVRAFGEGPEAERRAKRLGDKLKEALAVSPEDRRVSPDSLADLCRDLADAVGDGPPKTVEPLRPRPLPKPNQARSMDVRPGPASPAAEPPSPPPPVPPGVAAAPAVGPEPQESAWVAPEESPAPRRPPAEASPSRPRNDAAGGGPRTAPGAQPETQSGRSSRLLWAAAPFGLLLGSVSVIGCLGFFGRQLEGLFEATGDAIDPRPSAESEAHTAARAREDPRDERQGSNQELPAPSVAAVMPPPWERDDVERGALHIPRFHPISAGEHKLPTAKGSAETRNVTLQGTLGLAEMETTRALWAIGGGPETTARKDPEGQACSVVLGASKAADERPITCVSVREVLTWLNGLSKSAGYEEVYTIEANRVSWHQDRAGFRLPTRDEWEVGAWSRGNRAGKPAPTARGGWWVEGKPQLLKPVGTWEEPSGQEGWLLRDPHGNASELVWTEPDSGPAGPPAPATVTLERSSAAPWKCLGGGVTWNIDDDLAQTLTFQDSALLASAETIGLDAGFRLAWGAIEVDREREAMPQAQDGSAP